LAAAAAALRPAAATAAAGKPVEVRPKGPDPAGVGCSTPKTSQVRLQTTGLGLLRRHFLNGRGGRAAAAACWSCCCSCAACFRLMMWSSALCLPPFLAPRLLKASSCIIT
jgi:hypothetical protein